MRWDRFTSGIGLKIVSSTFSTMVPPIFSIANDVFFVFRVRMRDTETHWTFQLHNDSLFNLYFIWWQENNKSNLIYQTAVETINFTILQLFDLDLDRNCALAIDFEHFVHLSLLILEKVKRICSWTLHQCWCRSNQPHVSTCNYYFIAGIYRLN